MKTGHESFAEVMMEVRPRQASKDFLAYLALAPYEELRQIHMKTVNPIAANLILNHLQTYPPSVGDAYFDHLFVYAVSRNTHISNAAIGVLNYYYKNNRKILAMKLARTAPKIQIAFVGANKRNVTSVSKLFLADLRNLTPDENVIDEIDSIR